METFNKQQASNFLSNARPGHSKADVRMSLVLLAVMRTEEGKNMAKEDIHNNRAF